MPIATPETLLREAAKRAQQRVTEHLERFAAAYIKTTKLKPEEAVMCYRFDPDGTQRIWFQKKDLTDVSHSVCEAMAIRILGQERYDNSACQAHPLELIEAYVNELKTQLQATMV
jgi:hypothetical protein